MRIEMAISGILLENIRQLFREYQISLNIDLCFQDFEAELTSLPGKYQPPSGRLYIAFVGQTPAGCVALRRFSEDKCELKRLYVRPEFRGHGLSKLLLQKVITDAKHIGYRQMLLDTLPCMTIAQHLYNSVGFRQIPPYCFNPIPGARYMGLDLQNI